MSLIPWKSKPKEMTRREASPPGGLRSLWDFRDEMNRLFERFVREPWEGEAWSSAHDWMPTVDVAEKDKEIIVRAEVPGIDPADLEVSISGNILTISGEKRESVEETKEDYYHCERRFGSFRRSIELPATADLNSIAAEQKNGVLTVHVRKTAEARPKKVTIRKEPALK